MGTFDRMKIEKVLKILEAQNIAYGYTPEDEILTGILLVDIDATIRIDEYVIDNGVCYYVGLYVGE